MSSTNEALASQLREFNRAYTTRLGLLRRHLPGSELSLVQARLLWETGQAPGPILASQLSQRLDLDPGYVSRVIQSLLRDRLIVLAPAHGDQRRKPLRLSAKGRRVLARLDHEALSQVGQWIAPLSGAQRQRLHGALQVMQSLLVPDPHATATLRPAQSGDWGWIVARHGALYAQEFGWDVRFEGLVASIVGSILQRFDAKREAAWVLTSNGIPLGSVVLVQARDDNTGQPISGCAQLRLLLLEPEARGLGWGQRLTTQCEQFARSKGYSRIRLWTHQNLTAARAIYAKAGYTLVASEKHRSFGKALVGEHWELAL
jgi:DNA-binding MarR family transcriptional regulator/GNAT superfamily N-acetyltransferase